MRYLHQTLTLMLSLSLLTALTAHGETTHGRTLEQRSHAVTLIKNTGDLVPLSPEKGQRIALLSYGKREASVLAARLDRYMRVESYALQPWQEKDSIIALLRDYDQILFAITDGSKALGPALDSLLGEKRSVLLFLDRPDAVAYRSAVIAADAIALTSVVSTKPLDRPSDSEADQTALADALMGGIPFAGIFTGEDTSLFPRGGGLTTTKTRLAPALPEDVDLDSKTLAQIDAIAREGVTKGAYPGCQVLVAKDGYIVYDKAFGYKDAKKREPNDTETLYDIASMTKATATVPLVMMADDEERLQLGDRLDKHLDYLSFTNKGDVRLSQLLQHNGGMPAVLHFYEGIIDDRTYQAPLLAYSRKRGYPTQIEQRAWARAGFRYKSDLVSRDSSDHFPYRFCEGLYLSPQVREGMRQEMAEAPRRKGGYRYSDIDFLLLQDVLETIYDKSLDSLFAERVATPLGIRRLLYRPYTRFPERAIAEGQRDRFLRHRTLRGDVDDEAAAMLGGVCGNAGLFGNAESCAIVYQMLLNGGSYGGQQLIAPATVRHYTTYRHRPSPYALGFDRQRGGGRGNTCEEAPLSTYGHTGFTGTCFWVDPANNIVYVFLSNRGAPVRWNSKLSSLGIRKRIQSVIYNALDE